MPAPLIRLRVVDSTQAFLERHPELGFCGVLAGAQTLGRGRRDHVWESALDAGLWLSAALPVPSFSLGLAPQRAMAAVAEILGDCGARLGLKWPNDLVARRHGHLVKLGGIIGQVKGERMLLGVGVNLHSAPMIPGRAIPPACLKDFCPGALPDTTALARAILDAWGDLAPREPPFRWPDAGDRLMWEEGQGLCEGWLPDGRLAVRTSLGLQYLTEGDLVGLADPS
jgi:BirA family biotin operon repressor/biotin-[acetyl-CoA-carboxylase] ligase